MKKALQIGDTEVWGGSMQDALANYNKFDLVISLENPLVRMTKWKRLVFRFVAKINSPKHIMFKWPDFGVPDISKGQWLGLVKEIKKHRKVLVHCQGGIGRTGTALAIIHGLSDTAYYAAYPGVDSVRVIRQLYIPNAVETSKQAQYIDSIVRA